MALSLQERKKPLMKHEVPREQLVERMHLSKPALDSYKVDTFKDIRHDAP